MPDRTLSFGTANGDTTAFVAMPANKEKKAVIVIQEWWGLNDHIKDIAKRYADEGFIAIAPDLYRGKVAANPDEAGKMMKDLQIADGIDTIKTRSRKRRRSLASPISALRVSAWAEHTHCVPRASLRV